MSRTGKDPFGEFDSIVCDFCREQTKCAFYNVPKDWLIYRGDGADSHICDDCHAKAIVAVFKLGKDFPGLI